MINDENLELDKEEKETTWKDKLIFANLFPRSYSKNGELIFKSFCVYKVKDSKEYVGESSIHINEKKMQTKFALKKGFKIPLIGLYLNYYTFKITHDDVLNFPIQNKVFFKYDGFDIPIIYHAFDLKRGREKHGGITQINGSSLFLRQSVRNAMYFTVRGNNVTDIPKQRRMLYLAYLLSKLLPPSRDIILYEKETNRYEESASILYEKLVDLGYKNAYFILNKDSSHYQLVPDKYLENIVHAHTFKHYLKFFRCKKFISSESLQHVLELRVANKYVGNKFKKKKFKYVFLQHGVMYMVSLDADNRGFFQKGNAMPIDSKVVVSSKKEAQHFIDKAGFEMDDMYISGLLKFDRSILNDDADKITIMPTWRPWEYNEIRNDYKNSGYYQMISKIISAVPDNLKDKVEVLPHPLIVSYLQETDLNKYIPKIISYDLILRNTRILITDYSSVSYDSFYRGSNVIFWWQDKDACMEQYNGTLMLKEKEAFGDVCYNINELKKSIKDNYTNKQSKKYINRYRKLVTYYDNKNTDRLIEFLKRDKFI